MPISSNRHLVNNVKVVFTRAPSFISSGGILTVPTNFLAAFAQRTKMYKSFFFTNLQEKKMCICN